MSWNALQRAVETADDIEESSEPHVLWGLQGTSFVYCSGSGKSGRDPENLPVAEEGNNVYEILLLSTMLFIYSCHLRFLYCLVIDYNRSSTYYALPSTNTGAAAVVSSSSSSQSNPFPAPSVVSSSSSALSSAPALDSILQHRLFQSWQSVGSNSSSVGGGKNASTSTIAPPAVPVEVEEVIPSDDDEGVPSNPDQLEPVDRVRRARHLDGTTSMVRIEGGWMPRKKPRLIEAELEISCETKKIDSTIQDEEVKGPSESVVDTSNGVSDEVMIDLADRKRRILEKAAERAASGVVAISVANQYKNELIEAAVNAAQSSSHRRKNIVTPAMLTAAVNGTVPVSVAAQTLSDLRTSYQLRPSLCYLPLEDGGVRFTSVSFAQVPRSVHPLCVANLLCGVCMEYNEPGCTVITNSEDIPQKTSKRGPKKRASAGRNVSVEVERFHLRSVDCGAVQYFVHSQCLHATSEDFLSTSLCKDESKEGQEHSCTGNNGNKSDNNDKGRADSSTEQIQEEDMAVVGNEPVQKLQITLGELYQYEQPEDAECDLCGRKGGVLRYFRLAAHCSSLPVPSEDGWLAHVPCLQYLHSSRLLQPLTEKRSNAREREASADVAHSVSFALNPLSCDLLSSPILLPAQQQQQEEDLGNSADALQGPEESSSHTTSAMSPMNVDSTTSKNKPKELNNQEEDSEKEEQEEGEGELRQKLLASNRLHAQTPLSRFDQQYGLWRCTLCGLQCGIAPRCLGVACTVRAHPFCLLATNNPLWRICSVVTNTQSDNSSSNSSSDSASVGILCPVHSVGMLE